MKNKSTLLIVALATMAVFTGCKKNMIGINDEMKDLSNETFQSLVYCGNLEQDGYNISVTQYHVNHEQNTVERKMFTFGPGVATVNQAKTYSFAWGDFTESKLGRNVVLTADDEKINLVWLNNTFVESDGTAMQSDEPLADYASEITTTLNEGDWAAFDPVYVMQDRWTMDTTWYVTTRKGKKIIVDTITGRYKHAEKVIVGVDSQKIAYMHFYANPVSYEKTIGFAEGKQVNTVIGDTVVLPQKQNPAKNDTIITFKITENPATRFATDSANRWSYTAIGSTKFDVIYKNVKKDADDIFNITEYTGASFMLDGATYYNLNK